MSTLEIVTAIKDVVLATAGIVTAVVAVLGLKTWSRQLRGTADFEVARKLAKATYKLRDEIQIYRSPLIRPSEFPDGQSDDGSTDRTRTRANAYGHVFSARWEPVYAALQEFDTQTLEVEALWGTSVRTKTDELRRLLRVLWAATEAYIDNEHSGGEHFKSDREFGVKIKSEVFASPQAQDNELSKKFQAAVQAVEVELKPHLKRG
ncbi:hypothetical protein B9Z45_07880 [Limnohabitans sp. 2KL-17]|uniref:hypothetical protein n=1 Tax=Limnohabitans sp. 2KL-17 TaxID=1100704 RepID=UPI000D37B567|nr:hypothetical protein [Limnohabitans sp. 2KL-17]PUE57335.1 hypothetical protein B9Z45_07880 [Limnohabitans sp. 2KL-17]